jgi:hypothetical protein
MYVVQKNPFLNFKAILRLVDTPEIWSGGGAVIEALGP